MKDRAWFERKRAELKTQLVQLKADFNCVEGAVQFCDQAITECLSDEADAAKVHPPVTDSSSTVTAWPVPTTMTSIGD